MSKTSITMRMDDDLKTKLQELLGKLGMDMTTYFTLSAAQAVREQRVPFEISLETPNADSKEALQEIADMKKHPEKYKGYSNVDEMMKDLLA